jgi:hypothetical protein
MGAGQGAILLRAATQPHDVVPEVSSANAALSPGTLAIDMAETGEHGMRRFDRIAPMETQVSWPEEMHDGTRSSGN